MFRAARLIVSADRLLGPEPDLDRPRGLDPDRRASVVLWSSAVLLILLLFQGGFPTPGSFRSAWTDWNPWSLEARLYWSVWGYLFYMVIPVAIIVAVFRESPGRYGLRIYLTPRTAALYAGMVLLMAPLLYWASTQPSFLIRYPFARDLSSPGEIALWETVYVARFVALEFFFRGFLLFGVEERLGRVNAIAVSTIPYAMVHFAKPFPEALGALIAGAVLGWLALRTRSIAGGVVVHGTIALGMDLLALWRNGTLG